MAEKLSGVNLVLIVAGGVLCLILFFIFVKRQIMRFTTRFRRGPHMPTGHGAKKKLRKEIERRIDAITRICCEPKLLKDDPKYLVPPLDETEIHPSYFRMRAVDDLKTLENEICKGNLSLRRHPLENIRSHLLNTLTNPATGMGQKPIHQFCDLYERARFDPKHFGPNEYREYSSLLLKLIEAAKLFKRYNIGIHKNPMKNSPKKYPIKYFPEKTVQVSTNKNQTDITSKVVDQNGETKRVESLL